MPWWTWMALGFFLAVLVVAAVYGLVLARSMRVFAVTGERVTVALEELAAKGEALERRSAEVEARREAAQAHFDHLNATLERFSVLTWAIGDVAKTVTEVRSALIVRK
ncbi:MAG: hypothetical protein ABI649_08065 [Gaiellaceae bacterium]